MFVGRDGLRSVSRAISRLPVKVGFIDDLRLKNLFLDFENVGDSCEFGLVQRRYGAEPLGLFRWNTVRPADLIGCLESGLAGMGSPEHTILWKSQQPGSELMVLDRRWGFAMHTFVAEDQVDERAFHAKMCTRVAFLRDKFLDDLKTGRKVFVYSSAGLDREAAQAISAAFRAYGPTKLLAVTPPGTSDALRGQSGDLFEVDAHLCIGLLDGIGSQRPGQWNISFDGWVSLCEKAATRFLNRSP